MKIIILSIVLLLTIIATPITSTYTFADSMESKENVDIVAAYRITENGLVPISSDTLDKLNASSMQAVG